MLINNVVNLCVIFKVLINMEKKLILDLSQMTLGGITIGHSLSLQNEKDNAFDNYELGYSLNMVNGLVDNIFICLTDGYSGYKKFAGTFQVSDSFIELSELSNAEYIKQLFGAPESEWNDGVELNIRFLIEKYQLEFSWDVQDNTHTLTYICVDLS